MNINIKNMRSAGVVFSKTTAARASTSILSLVALSACRSPYTGEVSTEGAVIKGPLNNALVFFDYNNVIFINTIFD